MRWTIKLALLFAFLHVGVNSRSLREMTSYGNELTFYGKRILFGTGQIVTDSESYVYAVCNSQEFVFKENQCNVVIETPSFTNAIYKDTCNVNLATSLKNHVITEFKLYPFGDDKVLLSWQVENINELVQSINVRILEMSNCKYYEVALVADKLIGIIPYSSENNFDLIVKGNKICNSEICRITYNATGKQVGRPKQLLASNIKFVEILNVEPIAARSPVKGFYVLLKVAPNKLDEVQIVQVDAEGKGTQPNKVNNFISTNFVLSNAYEHFTTCWACDRTNITCRQYDSKLNLQLNVVLGFLDEPGFGIPRWMKIHNLPEGGFLLITGAKDSSNDRKFNNFLIVRIQPNGRRDRPLEIQDFSFECTSIKSLLVNVSENDEEEVCIHFACDRIHFDSNGSRSLLKYNSKCLHKSYVFPAAKHKISVFN